MMLLLIFVDKMAPVRLKWQGIRGLTRHGLEMPYDGIDLDKHDSGNALLPDGTKPLLEPMLSYH